MSKHTGHTVELVCTVVTIVQAPIHAFLLKFVLIAACAGNKNGMRKRWRIMEPLTSPPVNIGR